MFSQRFFQLSFDYENRPRFNDFEFFATALSRYIDVGRRDSCIDNIASISDVERSNAFVARVIQSNGAEYFASHHVIEKISRPSDHIPTNINYNVKHRYITNVYANSYLYEYLVALFSWTSLT